MFGDPSDIINNLSDDEDFLKSNEGESVNIDDNVSADDNTCDDLSVQYEGDVSKVGQKRPAWVDEDDVQCS